MAAWQQMADWSSRLVTRNGQNVAEPPGHLWFQMQAPDGHVARIHSGLASAKLQRGWKIQGEYLENLANNSEFPA